MSNEVKYLIVGDVNAQGSILFDSISAVDVPTPPAGKFALFNDQSNGNRLSSKDSGGIVTVVGSGGGGEVGGKTPINIRVPIVAGNPALHYALEIFATADYSGTAIESYNTASSQVGVTVNDGSAWIAFPAGGIGTPFYDNIVSVMPQTLLTSPPYYLRYKFYLKGTDPANEPWRYNMFPATLIGA